MHALRPLVFPGWHFCLTFGICPGRLHVLFTAAAGEQQRSYLDRNSGMKIRSADVKETPVMLSLMIALACTDTHTHTCTVWIACIPHHFLQLSTESVWVCCCVKCVCLNISSLWDLGHVNAFSLAYIWSICESLANSCIFLHQERPWSQTSLFLLLPAALSTPCFAFGRSDALNSMERI